MNDKPKRERGYKDVTDPEELKRKLAQWQQRQLVLQARKAKIESLIDEIDRRLKRTTTYVENIGHTLSLYKTYNHCWYTRDRGYQQMTFLQEFVPNQTEANNEGLDEAERAPVGPERAICYNIRARTLERGCMAFVQVNDPAVVIRIMTLERAKGCKSFVCTKTIEVVRNIGTIVPDLELLTVFGNREHPRLLEVLQAIPEKDWPILEQRYSNPSSTERRFFIHPEYGLCEILIYNDDR